MRILTVVGARPQFIKAAPVQEALRARGAEEWLVHTGQHYDRNMSQVFFDELGLRAPDVNLGVGSGSHAQQTSRMLVGLEDEMRARRPDVVLVYGDTNSTLAGALAAAKLNVPVAHVEAGLRSFNRDMPEEHNRVLTDHCADLLFCPTRTAVDLLAREGIRRGVHLVGDTMYDAVLRFAGLARRRSTALDRLGLRPGGYVLATIHRPYNTDVPENLANILAGLGRLDEPVVFPLHPRTRGRIVALGASAAPNVLTTDPAGYLDMLRLEESARAIVTDSGGVQKEAFFFGVPCVTVRPETEWVETVESGWNVLTGTDPAAIAAAVNHRGRPPGRPPALFGDGTAADKIARILAAG
jgi:UDP-N-acetylglucosamine 2-epimerase